jgi:aminopeptidase
MTATQNLKHKDYQPSEEILRRYADVLVSFALNSGKGVRAGEVVMCAVPDVAKPLAVALHAAILQAGGHPIIRLMPTGLEKPFFTLANDKQLTFFPETYFRAQADLVDHQISIIADVDQDELKDIDPSKLIKSRDARRAYREWLTDKEVQGKFTWTIGLWGTQAKADEVGLSLKDYWQQIIDACFLDEKDPVAHWKKLNKDQVAIKKKLNDMMIETVHVTGPDADIHFKLGADRVWNAGSGRNIPSFEFFTSPDWRGTNGWIRFNQPLYRFGQVLKGIYLEFNEGVVVKATAKQGQALLDAMLKSPNANKVGEFSLTDKRMSRITHVMAETLFDENISGPHGNTHLAVGMSYKDCYRGDGTKLTKADWEARGFNDSAEHTDIISTTERTVHATLASGETILLYENGMFPFYKPTT